MTYGRRKVTYVTRPACPDPDDILPPLCVQCSVVQSGRGSHGHGGLLTHRWRESEDQLARVLLLRQLPLHSVQEADHTWEYQFKSSAGRWVTLVWLPLRRLTSVMGNWRKFKQRRYPKFTQQLRGSVFHLVLLSPPITPLVAKIATTIITHQSQTI